MKHVIQYVVHERHGELVVDSEDILKHFHSRDDFDFYDVISIIDDMVDDDAKCKFEIELLTDIEDLENNLHEEVNNKQNISIWEED